MSCCKTDKSGSTGCSCSSRLMLPIFMISLSLAAVFSFETYQAVQDRGRVQQAIAAQETQYQDAKKLQAQFNGLVLGTQQLADLGNKDAEKISARLQELGLGVKRVSPEQAQAMSPPVPMPAAGNSPVKP